MRFIESEFRQLVEETEKTVMRLGTTSHAVLNRHRRFAEMLVAHLQEADLTFDLLSSLPSGREPGKLFVLSDCTGWE